MATTGGVSDPASSREGDLPVGVSAALAALPTMPVAGLRAEWRRLYRSEPPARLRRDTLELAVAWKLQAQALGGVSASAKRRLAGMADVLTRRSAAPKPRRASLRPGARLVREWGGQTHEIVVAEDGFVWRDRTWRSLSVIAREMTGTRWSGPRFFGLDRVGRGKRNPLGDDTDAAR